MTDVLVLALAPAPDRNLAAAVPCPQHSPIDRDHPKLL